MGGGRSSTGAILKQITTFLLLAIVLLAAGCASRGYVREEVSDVQTRLDEVEGQVEGVQTAVRKNEEEIERQREALENASKTAREAFDRAMAAGGLAEGKLLYEGALTDDEVRFGFDASDLSDEAKVALEELARKLLDENKGVYIEIQGHTDSIGSEDYNFELGRERAEAVRRFLNLRGIPLHRLGVISYGETEPIADGSNREGRAANRRVVLVVLQ